MGWNLDDCAETSRVSAWPAPALATQCWAAPRPNHEGIEAARACASAHVTRRASATRAKNPPPTLPHKGGMESESCTRPRDCSLSAQQKQRPALPQRRQIKPRL